MARMGHCFQIGLAHTAMVMIYSTNFEQYMGRIKMLTNTVWKDSRLSFNYRKEPPIKQNIKRLFLQQRIISALKKKKQRIISGPRWREKEQQTQKRVSFEQINRGGRWNELVIDRKRGPHDGWHGAHRVVRFDINMPRGVLWFLGWILLGTGPSSWPSSFNYHYSFLENNNNYHCSFPM